MFSAMSGEMAMHGTLPARLDQTVPWHAAWAGLCASLVGIGFARFGYMQLIPSLIAQQWFAAGDAAYLGAANLAGYLVGALLAVRMAALIPARDVLRAMMALAAVSFFACAAPLSFGWFFVWRFAAGFAGGALMVLAAPSILPHVPAARRGVVSGSIFMGVGLGIIASAVLVPLLLRAGLVEAWCGLGVATLVLAAASWNGWPRHDIEPVAVVSHRPATAPPPLKALYVQYALSAVGLVPHMMFLVDFVARGLGRGVDVGAQYLVLFGVGATIGPIIGGAVADRIGFRATLLATFVLQAVAVALLAVSAHWTALLVSSLAVGATTPGVVPLALGRVRELVPGNPQGQQAAWSVATITFSTGQAAGAYGFAFLLGSEGSYVLLFALAAVPFVLALAIEMVKGRTACRSTMP
jgi:predicted MFS family arabinose efflux permease